MDLNHLHLSQLRALPFRQQNMLRVKGLNMLLIVMLMCSEMGEIITPSGTERWRNGGEEPSDPRREGSGRGILMSAPEINKEISDLSVTCLQYPLMPTMTATLWERSDSDW